MRSVELFAGAGGLGLGLSLAGFHPELVVEWDQWCCDTLTRNRERGYPLVNDWRVVREDVRKVDYGEVPGPVDLVSGGPPCQPFSIGGKHGAFMDDRDMWPAAADVVRRLAPRAFLFENVKGITRASFINYFQYIQLRLSFPEVLPKRDEQWIDHLRRLERHKTKGNTRGLWYKVVARVLNAADHGVPQRRERVFIVGFRSDQRQGWSFPEATHSLDRLLWDQWATGEYWDRHEVPKRDRPAHAGQHETRARLLLRAGIEPGFGREKPWRSVRDAIADLPDPERGRRGHHLNHQFQDGAQVYPGHSGSPIDLPAKTLKAGDHGVPGGENMLVRPDGTVRYFTVRESARLQTFPDGYELHGSWTESMRQLGNAVPVRLARVVGASLAGQLIQGDIDRLSHQGIAS
ncbi:MAG: DNA cytosine methyltransferase [Candidatus Delongbacteria bacterium]